MKKKKSKSNQNMKPMFSLQPVPAVNSFHQRFVDVWRRGLEVRKWRWKGRRI